MCGIFGILLSPQTTARPVALRALLDRLFLLSESRGREASGLAIKSGTSVDVFKHPLPASSLIKLPEYSRLFAEGGAADTAPGASAGLALVGHSRLVTNGGAADARNNQPVSFNDVTAVHNGIVVNVQALWRNYSNLSPASELDSEIIPALVYQHQEEGLPVGTAVQRTFSQIEGSASVALVHKGIADVVLATNTGSLYLYLDRTETVCLFASESHIIRRVADSVALLPGFDADRILHLKAGEGRIVDLRTLSMQPLDVDASTPAPECATRTYPRTDDATAVSGTGSESDGLRRCTQCVLPETTPHITFDEAGVCSYCNTYRKMAPAGAEALEMILSAHRKGNGEPDCIFAFSGGRDSSYALHLLVKEFGMTPMALTYDWGMVTDLARRNQARLCGTLGVEHVLISADIAAKRSNIGKNIRAWLKKPELGMIPLFIAGDKQMFHHMNKLRRLTSIELVLFSINPLEKTDFKTGFCGIVHGEHALFYDTTIMNKFRFGLYFLRQILRNPAYINASLWDTFTAFLSSYFIPHDYVNVYDYVRWDENEVNRTLIRTYDWETAPDTTTTWRIGDGTAAFYNYIYGRIAGFNENDTFRSNQIREGDITRDQAVRLLSAENEPRWASMSEYLNVVDVDFDAAMAVIDSMPRLHPSLD